MPPGRLIGKAALVTGGGSGIGRAVCQVFAEEGANVAVLDINVEGAEETFIGLHTVEGSKHCSIPTDVTSAEQVRTAVKTATEKLGQKCTILVNCAGIFKAGPFIDASEADFHNVIDVNLKGVMLTSQAFIASLKNEGKEVTASIINISSIASKRGKSNRSIYAASKSAVVSMTQTVAVEHGKDNIRCNAVLPGFILTPMTAGRPQEVYDAALERIPLGRMGKPLDVAKACLFLASDESSYITGACLDVNGGQCS